VVEEATGPRPTDRRTRTSYVPDRAAEQREIDSRYAGGLHYVGDWHTHPEMFPSPSCLDIASISESVRKSIHALNGFVLMIVGQAEPPNGLFVSAHDRLGSCMTLEPHPRPAVNPLHTQPKRRAKGFPPEGIS
jgi:integrative and conjugative element protein (TIGR02256 family)